MSNSNTPNDGDFASYLDAASKKSLVAPEFGSLSDGVLPQERKAERQTLDQVLVEGQEPTEEFLEELKALEAAPELSDEEFERQALSAPGDDGDPSTPE
jgi:hypothetical protein